MNKKIILIIIGVVLVIGGIFLPALVKEGRLSFAGRGGNAGIVTIADKSFKITFATTEVAREKGLGDIKKLPQDSGMLFVFTTPAKYAFWMKDTLIPLDMIWIDENFKIIYIANNVVPETYPKTFYPDSPALYVLEVNAGVAEKNNWKIGDVVAFPAQKALE